MTNSTDLIIPDEDEPRLTPQQNLFLQAYMGDARGNVAEASRIAGYPNRFAGHQLMKNNPQIREIVAAYMDQMGATTQEVIEELAKVAMADMHYHMQEIKPAGVDKHGNPTMAIYRYDLSSKVRALELMLKLRGMFTEKIEQDTKIEVVVRREDRHL